MSSGVGTEASVCHVPEGQEAAVALALGGAFVLEDCGVFAKCDHSMERYDLTAGPGGAYAQWHVCSADYIKIGGVVAGVLVLLAVLYIMYRRARRGHGESAQVDP